jgi:hypothetical protein
MPKEKSIRLAGIREGALVEVAARIYGCKVKDLLSWSEKEDGSVVIIAPTGQKFTYSAEEIVQAVPRVAVLDCAGTGAVIRDVGAGGDGGSKADEEEEEPKEPEGPKEARKTRKRSRTTASEATVGLEEGMEVAGAAAGTGGEGGGEKDKAVARKRGRRAGTK